MTAFRSTWSSPSRTVSGRTRPNTHRKWVPRPWWKWRLVWGDIRRWHWAKGDSVEVPCPTPLTKAGRVKIEQERMDLKTKVVASRQYWCPEPSVQGADQTVIMYAAAIYE